MPSRSKRAAKAKKNKAVTKGRKIKSAAKWIIGIAVIILVAVVVAVIQREAGTNKAGTTSSRLVFMQHQYNLSVGEEVWISFRGELLNNTARIESTLSYDHGILEHKGARDVSNGNLVLDSVSTPNIMKVNQYREPGIYGNGELFRLLFKAKKTGETTLKLQEVLINGKKSAVNDEVRIVVS